MRIHNNLLTSQNSWYVSIRGNFQSCKFSNEWMNTSFDIWKKRWHFLRSRYSKLNWGILYKLVFRETSRTYKLVIRKTSLSDKPVFRGNQNTIYIFIYLQIPQTELLCYDFLQRPEKKKIMLLTAKQVKFFYKKTNSLIMKHLINDKLKDG